MQDVTINIDKSKVYEEIAKTTTYTGQKMDGEGVFDKVVSTEADQAEMFKRFWHEACMEAIDSLKVFIKPGSAPVIAGEAFEARLELSSAYDTALNGSVTDALFSFFVMSILSKWYALSNPDGVTAAMANAKESLLDAMRKLYYRKRPTRVKPRKSNGGTTTDPTADAVAPVDTVGPEDNSSAEPANPTGGE